MNKQKILIFGSGSILSSELVRIWEDIYDVTIGFSGEKSQIKSQKVKSNSISDILNLDSKFDIVVIISAYIPVKNQDSKKLYDVNVNLVEKIVTQFHESKIIFCSTISVYNPISNGKIIEDDLLLPQNEYAISKLWAEKIITTRIKNYAIFRISSLIGEGMNENTFVPYVLNSAIQKKKIVLFGNGKRLQNYIHVSDLANMINNSIKEDARGILLGVNTESYSNLEIAQEIKKMFPEIKIEFEKNDESLNYCFDAKKTFDLLKYIPKKKINNIIEDLVQWKVK